MSSGAGPIRQRPGFLAETIPEDMSESLDNNCKGNPDKVLMQRILVFWRNHREVLRASTRQRLAARVAKHIAIQQSMGDNLISKALEAYIWTSWSWMSKSTSNKSRI